MGGGVMRNAMKVSNGTFRGPTFSPASGQSAMKPSRPASAAMSSSSAIDQVSAQSPHSELETKSSKSELVPKPALQAFQFLSASSEAQTVVASIVSDPKVRSAIMQNPVLNEFLHSQKKVTSLEPNKSSVVLEEMPDSDEISNPKNGLSHSFNGFMQNVKHTYQAFQYLSASSEAQTVVASIVSDPNVRSVIMQNSVLNDYLQKKVFEPNKSFVKQKEMPNSDETSSPKNGFFHRFYGFVRNVKDAVAEMLSGASSYLQNLFGFLSQKMGSDDYLNNLFGFLSQKMGSDDSGKPDIFSDSDDAEKPDIFSDRAILVETFFKLAVVVATVVLFRRV